MSDTTTSELEGVPLAVPQFDPAEVEKLDEWFTGLHPRIVDVVGDFSGQELFVIHGDSLVRHCLETGNVDYTDGLQILHAVYEIEKLLESLQSRKCNFHVIFFRNHARLCIPSGVAPSDHSGILLARNIIVEHLRKFSLGPAEGASGKLVQEFDHPHDDAFARYLSDNAVHFFLCHDGNASVAESDPDTIWLRAFIYSLVSQDHNIALFSRIELVNTKVFLPLVPGTGNKLEPLGITELVCPDGVLPSGWMEKFQARFGEDHDDSSPAKKFYAEKMTTRDFVFAAVLQQFRDSEEGLIESLKLNKKESMAYLAFAIHNITLRESSLSERNCQLSDTRELDSAREFLRRFCYYASEVVRGLGEDQFVSKLAWDLFDLVDGRVFLSIYSRLEAGVPIPAHIKEDVEELCEAAINWTLPDVKDVLYKPLYSAADAQAPVKTLLPSVEAAPEVLPFKHAVLGPFLAEIKLSEAKQDYCGSITDKIFEELTHWHNQKTVSAYKKPVPVLGFRASKRRQRMMADISSYSASLTNAQGKMLEPEVIIVGTQSAKPSTKTANPHKVSAQAESSKSQGKGKGKKPASGKQAALNAARQVTEKSVQNKQAVIFRFWKDFCARYETKGLLDRYLDGLKYLSDLAKDGKRALAPEIHLYLCDVLVSAWAKRKDESSRTASLYILGLVWYHVMEITKMPEYTPEVANATKATVSALALPEVSFAGTATASRALSFRLHSMTAIPRTPDHPKHFQLMHAGPYMERTFGSMPDPRVSFEPDEWQRKVLDTIDADKSIFVVAPTSAGKTFISFYAMKQILQTNDDDVIVYVAPTKALVNQIAAEIGAQFSKTYHKGGRCLWSVKTRDNTINDPVNAQILVTVPHMLQIMLLSPANAERASSWSRRIKRIIFDEVHCIGQAEDGVIWEQLLLMAPCPIIALSATVGNAAAMRDWLASTQKKRGLDLDMIVHDVRYSDLRKFVYVAPETFKFDGLQAEPILPVPGLDEGGSDNTRFLPVHPLAALIDRKRGSLDDVTLEPRDTLELWRLMERFQTPEFPLDKSLDPDLCLPSAIKKADYVAWESRLKSEFHQWMRKPNSPFTAVRAELRKRIEDLAPGLDRKDRGPLARDKDGNWMTETPDHGLLALLCDLHAKDSLPAIVFNYDRSECVQDLKGVFNYLMEAETKYKRNSSRWAHDIREYEKWQSKSAARVAGRALAAREEKTSKLERARTEGGEDASRWASFDPNAPLLQYSFANVKRLTTSDFRDIVSSLDQEKVQPWLVQALQRGLGVHHSGMNRRYRQAVEIMFRRGFLRVVIATGTLALGINMPCKTVVFDGDSLFLTALNYRQAAGRAGRRGFDLLGNVVFYNISKERVFEIMSSRLPDLHGQFALSTSLVLRLFTLMSETKESNFSVDTVQALLSQTRLYLGGPEAAMSIKHHLRFSIEYLRRQFLLSSTGTPLNFSGMVSHLYFTENSAFAFHSLLKGGYFHDLCSDIDRRPHAVMLELCLVLSHLFCRIPVMAAENKRWVRETVHRSASVVFLPPLPSDAERLLRGHNEETLEIFRSYVRSYATDNLADTPDRVLPFTKTAAGAEKSSGIDTFDRLPPTTVRSQFVALSGHNDTFATIKELCSTVRSDVFLEESAVPYVKVAGHDLEMPLNAYVYDFFKHGSMEVLVRDNRIRGSDVWFHLKDFYSVLLTVTTSLRNFVSAEPATAGGPSDDEDGYDAFGDEADPELLRSGQDDKVTKKPEPVVASVAVDDDETSRDEVADNWDDVSDDSDKNNVKDDATTRTRSQTTTATGVRTETPTSLASFMPSWRQEDRGGLAKVVQAFEMFRDEFDVKFKKVWA